LGAGEVDFAVDLTGEDAARFRARAEKVIAGLADELPEVRAAHQAWQRAQQEEGRE